jgi:hypothetical protein
MDLKILAVLMDALMFVAELEDRALNKNKVPARSSTCAAGPRLQVVLHLKRTLRVLQTLPPALPSLR